MRKCEFTLALAAMLAGPTLGSAGPMPTESSSAELDVSLTRLVCNPERCVDLQTGAYTQSGCDYRGCYPIGGIVGYSNSAGDRPGSGGEAYRGVFSPTGGSYCGQ
jgi:hypothetical protein